MKKTIKRFLGLFMVICLLLGTISGCSANTPEDLSESDALDYLQNYLKKIDVKEGTVTEGMITLNPPSLEEELPDISNYPFTIEGKGGINIEIVASTEKAGTDKDGWLVDVAKQFNNSNTTVNGKKASVSIRSISSGIGADYIISQKYLPHAFSPSNELVGSYAQTSVTNVEKKGDLVSNVGGFVIRDKMISAIKEKYGEVNLGTIVEYTISEGMQIAYTDPYKSSTGINFMASILRYFDSNDYLSTNARQKFVEFQAKVRYVADDTTQMKESATEGKLDGFVMEYQNYKSTSGMSGYTFVPFGVKHENPIYKVGEITSEEEEVLDLFIQYCKSDESQKKAVDSYDFSYEKDIGSYSGETSNCSGSDIKEIQRLWKQEKDINEIAAVFVADVSGSMSGEPLSNLKKSLVNGSYYIKDEHHIGLVTYNDKVTKNLNISPFNDDQRAKFVGTVESLSDSGGTATYNAVLYSINMLLDYKKDHPDVILKLFVLSDGANMSGYSLNDIRPIVEALGIQIYTIGYNESNDELEKLARINEASYFNASEDDITYKMKQLFNTKM